MTAHQRGYIAAVRDSLVYYEEIEGGDVLVTHMVEGVSVTYRVNYFGGRTKQQEVGQG